MSHKILIVGPAWVGDMVMAQSLFKVLKQTNPAIQIDVLAPEWSLSLLSRMPEVSRAIALPFKQGELKLLERYRFGKTLRSYQYDQAIVLPNSWKSAFIPWAAKIPKRTGWRGEFRFGLLNDLRHLDQKKYPLMVERFIALALAQNANLPTIPFPELQVSPESQSNALEKFKLSAEKKMIALCPGAEFGSAKRWPAEHFAIVANQKLKEGYEVLLLGSAKDKLVTDRIMQLTQDQCVNLAGKTSLDEAIDLLSLAHKVVSNDSGLMHVAAALKKSLIVLYGSTSPAFTPPLSSERSILQLQLSCQPCFQRECPLKHHRCMIDLTPEMVLKKME